MTAEDAIIILRSLPPKAKLYAEIWIDSGDQYGSQVQQRISTDISFNNDKISISC